MAPSSEIVKGGRFGWGNVTPNCLQRFHTVEYLVFFLVCCNCAKNLEHGYLISISETLQTTFYFSNVQIGLIVSAGSLSALLLTLPIVYLSSNGHKGRWISVACALSVISGYSFILPKFLTHSPELVNGARFGVKDLLNQSNAIVLGRLIPAADSYWSFSNTAFAIFISVQLISSLIGGINTLMLAYVEQNAKQSDIAMFSTLIGGLPSLFFAGGFLVSPAIQYLYSNVEGNSFLDTWWVGFLISPTIHLLMVLPLFGFAAQLPEYDSNRLDDIDQSHSKQKIQSDLTDEHGFPILGSLGSTISNLVCNPVFMLVSLRGSLSLAVIVGVTSFLMVYLQHAFGFTKSEAAVITAVCWIFGYVIGNIVGSVIVKVYGFLIKDTIMLCLVTMIASSLLMLVFLLNCRQFEFSQKQSDFLRDYNLCQEQLMKKESFRNFKSNSISQKTCLVDFNLTIFSDPVCGVVMKKTGISENFADNCKCFNILPRHFNNSVFGKKLNFPSLRTGACFKDYGECKWRKFYFGLLITLASVIGGMGANPAWQAVLHSVPANERAVAIGLVSTFNGVNTIIGPVTVGVVMDKHCLTNTKLQTGRMLCSQYNIDGISMFFCILFMISGGVGSLMLAMALKIYKPAKVASRIINCPVVRILQPGQEYKCKQG